MGILLHDYDKEIKGKVQNLFGKDDGFLVVMKHNSPLNGLAKLLLSNLIYALDSNRTFILYFDEMGIHKTEISHSTKGAFTCMPWQNIEDFSFVEKGTKNLIAFRYDGKTLQFEVPFDGKIFFENKRLFEDLRQKNWFRS